jgi:hypothetical protein
LQGDADSSLNRLWEKKRADMIIVFFDAKNYIDQMMQGVKLNVVSVSWSDDRSSFCWAKFYILMQRIVDGCWIIMKYRSCWSSGIISLLCCNVLFLLDEWILHHEVVPWKLTQRRNLIWSLPLWTRCCNRIVSIFKWFQMKLSKQHFEFNSRKSILCMAKQENLKWIGFQLIQFQPIQFSGNWFNSKDPNGP